MTDRYGKYWRTLKERRVLMGVLGILVTILLIAAACGEDATPTPGPANATPQPTPTAVEPIPTDTPTPPLPDKSEGILIGSVTIGPLCPVEPCPDPIPDVYASRELLLLREGRELIRLPLGPEGAFQALIPAGRYMVELTDCDFLGCARALPMSFEIRDGEPATLNIDIDTGIRAPVQGPNAYLQLFESLRAAGAAVATGEPITQPFFSVPGRFLGVNGSDVQVFEYPSIKEAQSEADQVAPDGSSVGTSIMFWVAGPHFYSSGTLIVLYVGDDAALQTLLEEALGPQFAGR